MLKNLEVIQLSRFLNFTYTAKKINRTTMTYSADLEIQPGVSFDNIFVSIFVDMNKYK